MLKKVILGHLASVFCGVAFGQSLYVPGGATSGIGANTVNGNIGIETSSPGAKLHVAGSNQALRFDYNGTENYFGSLRWAGLQLGNNGWNRIVAGRTAAGGGLAFYVNNTNDGADYNVTPDGNLALAITPGGNVGIGTLSPGALLDVVGGPFRSNGGIVSRSSEAAGLFAGYGSGLDGSSLQLFALYADTTNGLYFDAPKDSGGNRLDIQFNWRGGGTPGLFIKGSNGNVGIGSTSPTHKLAVDGTIRAKEIIVDTGWADYVFADDYRLSPLDEVEAHIKEHRHLPGIPSAAEVDEHGVSLGEMQTLLLAKVEELTLHQIQQAKDIATLKAENSWLRQELSTLSAKP